MARIYYFLIIGVLVIFCLFQLKSNVPAKRVVVLSSGSEPDDYTVGYYQRHTEARRKALCRSSVSYGILYNVLVPEVFCKDLVRIGVIGDGGKWICNPIRMLAMRKCTVYSLGTHNDPSFEVDFQVSFLILYLKP